jgi:hypothetical protein
MEVSGQLHTPAPLPTVKDLLVVVVVVVVVVITDNPVSEVTGWTVGPRYSAQIFLFVLLYSV